MDDLITVRTFFYHTDMIIPKSLLESEGIECFLQDELMSGLYPGTGVVGGIKLQVKTSDLERAIEVLKAGNFLKDEDLKPSGIYQKIENLLSKFERKKNK